MCDFNYIMSENSALIRVWVFPSENRIIMFMSSEIMYVVRMVIFSWLKVTVKHIKDLPFLRIICIIAVLRLTYSGPYHPRFVKDGKLPQPSRMFGYGCRFFYL